MVQRMRSGDSRAAGETWRALAPGVLRVLRRGLGPDTDVDDLGQEVFLRLFKAIDRIEDPAALRSFATGIAVRVLKRELRRRWIGRWLRLSPSLPPEAASRSPHATLDAREALRGFYALLDKLGTTARTLFVLRHIEQLELTDVARATDLSLATVKRHLARAEARVAILLAHDPALATYASELAPRFGGVSQGAPEARRKGEADAG